jgi:hypothetical protein
MCAPWICSRAALHAHLDGFDLHAAVAIEAAVPPEAARYLTQALATMPAPPEFGSFGFRDASMDSLRHVGHLP